MVDWSFDHSPVLQHFVFLRIVALLVRCLLLILEKNKGGLNSSYAVSNKECKLFKTILSGPSPPLITDL